MLWSLSVVLVLLGLLPKVLRQTKKTADLVEGDIPAQSFVELDGHIQNFEPPSILELFSRIRKKGTRALNDLQPQGRIVCDSRLARGLDEKELAEIKVLHAKKNFPDEIETKESAAFVPAMLFAFLLLNLLGDVFWNLVLA